jgi:hypothetical protein
MDFDKLTEHDEREKRECRADLLRQNEILRACRRQDDTKHPKNLIIFYILLCKI